MACRNLLQITEKVWDKLFESNVKSVFMLSKLCVPHMEQQGFVFVLYHRLQFHRGGNIVFIASVAGYSPNNVHTISFCRDIQRIIRR